MLSTEQSALEVSIREICTKHQEAHWEEYGYRHCVSIGTEYFVKFGNPDTLWPEIATLKYISDYAQSHPDTPHTPRIPKVIHHFGDKPMMYLLMEYITLSNPPSDLHERTIEALRWLSSVPAPPGHVFGPLGGGLIRHRFFRDYQAPLVFSSIGALERYIERVRPFVLITDLLRSHLNLNFGVDEHGNTVLMDFEQIAMLPESFAVFAYPRDIATSLGISTGSNLSSMAPISACLWMVADSKLGLNEDGSQGAHLQTLDELPRSLQKV